MNKRILFFVLLVFFVFLLFACTANECEITYEPARENRGETVMSSGPNYRIVETDEPLVRRYEILNNYGEIVRSGTGWRMPSIRNISEDVLEISLGAGTDTWVTQFYSAKDDALSESFVSAIVITNELIGLLKRSEHDGTVSLIIRDIWDAETYYNAFLLEDFSRVANQIGALQQLEYLSDGRVEITYLSGQDFVERTTIFVL